MRKDLKYILDRQKELLESDGSCEGTKNILEYAKLEDCKQKIHSDAKRSTYGCGEVKEDLGNRTCWRKNLCKDCLNIRSGSNKKLYAVSVNQEEVKE